MWLTAWLAYTDRQDVPNTTFRLRTESGTKYLCGLFYRCAPLHLPIIPQIVTIQNRGLKFKQPVLVRQWLAGTRSLRTLPLQPLPLAPFRCILLIRSIERLDAAIRA